MGSNAEASAAVANDIPSEFAVDEAYYLNRYPDMAVAIENNAIRSADEHFQKYGMEEGRIPNGNFGDQFLRWLRLRSGTAKASTSSEEPIAQVAALATLQGIQFFQSLDAKDRYWRARDQTQNRKTFVEELVRLAPSLGERERIFTFNWLLANHEHVEVETLISSVEGIDDQTIIPSLAKAVDVYCIDTGRLTHLRDQLLAKVAASVCYDQALSEQSGIFADDLVRSHACEIHARYNTVSNFALPRTAPPSMRPSEKHIFVGFFGQLRFPEETLPKLADLFRTSLPNIKMSFGLATWNRQGVRVLDDDHPVNFACEQLPREIEAYCLTRGIHSVRRFSEAFPSLTSLL